MADHRPCLCVFAKVPSLGRVKSRLAAELGAGAALEAYITLVERGLERLSGTELPLELWVDGDPAHHLVQAWARRHALTVRRQPCGDLGRKMHEAIRRCCAGGRPGIVIGSDLPEVDAAYVDRAAALLEAHDVVLGPTEDGGYALVGLKAPLEALFADIPWGTGLVYARTREKSDRLGLSTAAMPETWDVDTLADWQRFQGSRTGHGNP